MTMSLWVTIPAYNEEKTLPSTLERLYAIHKTGEEFQVVICDNSSTDKTKTLAEEFIRLHNLNWEVIVESEKGTGAAADTAIKYAISKGATHIARTDADCLPALDWLKQIKNLFANGQELISGRITARRDDTNITSFQANLFNNVVPLAAWFGKVRPSNRGPEYKGSYVMTAGCNMAITSELYEKSKGFPRTKIEETHEDHVLVNRVRKVTDAYGYFRQVHVEVSARRIATWGIVNTLKWYANHSYCPPEVDIR